MAAGVACAAFLVAGIPAAHADTAGAALIANAQTATTTPSSVPECGITKEDIAKIAAVQNDPTLAPSEEMMAELAVRKQLIGKVIACAQNEVGSLRTSLGTAATSTFAEQAIEGQLQGRLDDASNFYSIELGKLGTAGLAGTKAIASDVLAWREGTYAPLAQQVGDFLLWSGNQELFSIAGSRMTQTQQAVSFLEGASNNADLQNAFNAAYASFESAKSANAAAQSALQQSLPPDQTLVLIKQSLDSLQSTYQQFFNVSGIIQKLLPQ